MRKISLVLALLFISQITFAFSYEDVVNLIQDKHVHSIEQLLPLLPAEVLHNYTLMYQSQSLQSASYANPRAILFSKDAEFVASFNGDSSQHNYSHFEMIQFRKDTKTFEFRSIDFSDPNRIVFSEANPKLCLSCHSQSPRPIWANYPNWPGAFGSHEDFLTGDEKAKYRSFRALAGQHPRYKWLAYDQEDFPYLQNGQHQYRPNNRMGKLFARLEAQRIANEIHKSPFYQSHPATVLLGVLGCSDLESPANANYKENLKKSLVLAFPQNTNSNLYLDLQNIQALELSDKSPGLENYFTLEKLTTGLSIYDWNLDLHSSRESVRYNIGFGSDETIDRWIAARLIEFDFQSDPVLGAPLTLQSYKTYYDNINSEGATARSLEPGGILEIYDSEGLIYDPAQVSKICPTLFERSKHEFSL